MVILKGFYIVILIQIQFHSSWQLNSDNKSSESEIESESVFDNESETTTVSAKLEADYEVFNGDTTTTPAPIPTPVPVVTTVSTTRSTTTSTRSPAIENATAEEETKEKTNEALVLDNRIGFKLSESQSNSINAIASKDENFRLQEEDLTDALLKWTAPAFIQKNYPYYLSGYDEIEHRPIWVMEFGKMDVRSLVETGGELLDAFEKYTEQISYRVLKSMKAAGANEVVFLVDFEGLELRQMTYPPAISFCLRLVFKNRDLILNYLGPTIFINTNFVAESAIRLARPALGRAFQKVEVFGTNKQKWIPRLRRLLGASQIPPWYGGSKDYKPVAVFGR